MNKLLGYNYWYNLAATNLRTNDKALIAKVAESCVEQEKANILPSIWHTLSLVTGNTCHCVPCSRSRK